MHGIPGGSARRDLVHLRRWRIPEPPGGVGDAARVGHAGGDHRQGGVHGTGRPGPVGAAGTPEARSGARVPARPALRLAGPAVAEATGPLPQRLATALGLPVGAVPATGTELLVVELAEDPTPVRTWGDRDGFSLAVSTGADSRKVAVPGVDSRAGVLAVSVRIGGHPVLRVTDAGRTQSLDLVSGRRGPDAIAGYYPTVAGHATTDSSRYTTLRLNGAAVAQQDPADRTATLGLGDADITLEPWVAGLGWAKPGRAWLSVLPLVSYERAGMLSYEPDVVVVPRSCFRGTDDLRRAVPFAGDPVTIGNVAGAESSGTELLSDVPVTLRQVTLVLTFCGSIRTTAGAVTYRVEANPSQTARVDLT